VVHEGSEANACGLYERVEFLLRASRASHVIHPTYVGSASPELKRVQAVPPSAWNSTKCQIMVSIYGVGPCGPVEATTAGGFLAGNCREPLAAHQVDLTFADDISSGLNHVLLTGAGTGALSVLAGAGFWVGLSLFALAVSALNLYLYSRESRNQARPGPMLRYRTEIIFGLAWVVLGGVRASFTYRTAT
jgi:hypothetical protein